MLILTNLDNFVPAIDEKIQIHCKQTVTGFLTLELSRTLRISVLLVGSIENGTFGIDATYCKAQSGKYIYFFFPLISISTKYVITDRTKRFKD